MVETQIVQLRTVHDFFLFENGADGPDIRIVCSKCEFERCRQVENGADGEVLVGLCAFSTGKCTDGEGAQVGACRHGDGDGPAGLVDGRGDLSFNSEFRYLGNDFPMHEVVPVPAACSQNESEQ